tara:strand:- start:73717 stop:75984 length:2268 start_codon:yes stop_codon:yes gene_type:complete
MDCNTIAATSPLKEDSQWEQTIDAALRGNHKAIARISQRTKQEHSGDCLPERVGQAAFAEKPNYYAKYLWSVKIALQENDPEGPAQTKDLLESVIDNTPKAGRHRLPRALQGRTKEKKRLRQLRLRAITDYYYLYTNERELFVEQEKARTKQSTENFIGEHSLEADPTITENIQMAENVRDLMLNPMAIRLYIAKKLKNLLEEAAYTGHAGAQFNLAAMHDCGIDMIQDTEKALRWYKKAGKHGDNDGRFYAAEIYRVGASQGSIVAVDSKKAYLLYKKAAQHKHASSLMRLGEFYANGIYVQQDVFDAIDYYLEAILHKSSGAFQSLANLINTPDLLALELSNYKRKSALKLLRDCALFIKNDALFEFMEEGEEDIRSLREKTHENLLEHVRNLLKQEEEDNSSETAPLLEDTQEQEEIAYVMRFIEDGLACLDELWIKPARTPQEGIPISVDKTWAMRLLTDKDFIGLVEFFGGKWDEHDTERIFKLGRYFLEMQPDNESPESYKKRARFIETLWGSLPKASIWHTVKEAYTAQVYCLLQYPEQRAIKLYKKEPWNIVAVRHTYEGGLKRGTYHNMTPLQALEANKNKDPSAAEKIQRIHKEAFETVKTFFITTITGYKELLKKQESTEQDYNKYSKTLKAEQEAYKHLEDAQKRFIKAAQEERALDTRDALTKLLAGDSLEPTPLPPLKTRQMLKLEKAIKAKEPKADRLKKTLENQKRAKEELECKYVWACEQMSEFGSQEELKALGLLGG